MERNLRERQVSLQNIGRNQRPLKRLGRSGSKIRRYSAFVVSGTNIVLHEGWGTFWRKFRNKTKSWLRRPVNSDLLYQHWIPRNEPAPAVLEKQRQRSLSFKLRPGISLITPVRNPEPELFRRTIDSLVKQTYANWELCLVDTGSDEPLIKQILQEYASRDSRIKVKLLPENQGNPGNSEALSMASGEFIALLDQGDELAPFALYAAVKALNSNPSLDLIYADEDKINVAQKRSAAFFKPGWSPDMLLSFMYTGRLSLYRKRLVDEIGGFRPEYDGSQEYDLVLRLIEKTNRIFHIPEILYHRRVTPRSGFLPRGERQIVPGRNKGRDDGKIRRVETRPELDVLSHQAAVKALTDYLVRNQIKGEVIDGTWNGSFRVRRAISGNPLVSIILPTKDKVELLQRCVESVWGLTEYKNYEILIVDNQSTKTKALLDYYQKIGKLPRTRIIEYNRPFNYAALNNFAVSQAKGEYLLFLNNDMEVISREWLSAMLEQSQRKEVGAVGAKLLYPDGSIQHCGVILGLGQFSGHACRGSRDQNGYFGRAGIINDYSAVTAACMMVRRKVFDEMSGFDENLAVDFNDIDLCLRMRQKGYLIVYTPYSMLYHLESYTRGYARTRDKLAMYSKEYQYVEARWGNVIERGDPYYNPNLSLTSPDFSLAQISRWKTDIS